MKSWLAFALGGLLAAVVATAVYQKKISNQQPVATTEEKPALPVEPPPSAAVDPAPAVEPPPPSPVGARVPRATPQGTVQPPAQISGTPPSVIPPASNPPAATPQHETPAPPAIVPAPPKEPTPPPRVARTVTLPEGTLVSVRLAERVSSATHQPGDSFTATLDQPLVVDGLVIAERGAKVDGKIVESRQAGRVKGLAYLAMALTRFISADGQRVNIQTAAFEKEAEKETTRDATKVGVGAAIGAAIGAIAGGGKGAAIGGAAGAGAGAGTVLATRGKPVELPTETRLTFRLAAPVPVTENLK